MADLGDFPEPPQLIGGDDLSQFEKAPSIGNDFSMDIPQIQVPKFEFPAAPKLDIPQPPTAQGFPETFKKEKTVGGFAKNFIDDATESLKGLGHLIFVDLPQATLINPGRAAVGGALGVDQKWRDEYLKNWSDRVNRWSKDPAGQAIEGGGVLLHAIADPYWDFKKDEFKWDFWYDRPFTVLADAATIASLGSTGAAKAAGWAGKATTAGQRLAKAGEILGQADKVLNPINWVTTAGSKLASPILESFGIGEHSPALTKIVSETRAEQAAEREAARPTMTGVVKEARETESNIPELLRTKAKESIGPLTPDEAADILKQAEEQVKRRRGIKEKIADIEAGKLPDTEVINNRISDAFFDIKWRKETLNRINDYLIDNNLISKTPIAGYDAANLSGLKQFHDTYLNLLEEYKKGFDVAREAGADGIRAHEAGSASMKAFTDKIGDLKPAGDTIYVPKHVAKFLQHEFVPKMPGMYDDVMKFWKPLVTSFRFPFYQAQVWASNLGMSLLYGVNPITDWALTNKLRKAGAFSAELQDLPHARWADELSRGEGAFSKLNDWYQRAAKWAGEGTAGSDALLRQAIATKFIKKELQDTVYSALKAGKSTEEAITEILGSKQALRDTLDAIKGAKEGEIGGQVAARQALEEMRPAPDVAGIRQAGEGSINIRQPVGKEAFGRGRGKPRIPKMEEIGPGELTDVRYPQNVVPGMEELGPLTPVGGKRMPEGAATPRETIRGGEGREAIRQPTRFIGEEAYEERAAWAAQQQRLRTELEARIPDYQKKIELLDKAIDEANRWTGNSLALHPFERNVLNRFIPFYSYTKAMTSLAFSAAILYPKRMFALNRLHQIMIEQMHDKNTPEWVQEYVPFGFDQDGNVMAFRLGSLNPFSGTRGEEFGDLPIPSMIDPTRNPMVKIVYEMAGGTPHWSKKPVSPGEYAVRYGDGSVYEYQKDGTFKKVIAQPSVLKMALNTVPQLQALYDLATPYVVDDRLNPVLGPDGKPRFPKDMWIRLLGLGHMRGAEYKPEELQTQMQKKGAGILKEFRQALRNPSLTPEQRQNIIDILRDASKEHQFKIENQ